MRWEKAIYQLYKRFRGQILALISCHKCTALITHSEKCWWDDLFSFVTFKMKTLNKERGSSGTKCGNASNTQERDTAASQIKATGRSWGEQWDNPNETTPAFSLAKNSNIRSLQAPFQPEPWQGQGRGTGSSQGRREHSEEQRAMLGWACFSCSQKGALGSCWSEERVLGGEKGKIRQRPLLTAHRHHRDLL